MIILAWLYFYAPQWVVSLLPDSVNKAEDGRFHDAVEMVYNRRVERSYRKIRKRRGG